MLKIKVGTMPGKLVEVIVNEGTTARDIFEIANVEISNHEIRLDGTKVDLDAKIESGNLLVAMKMIKGNVNTIKVGQMPGKLVTVEYENGVSARIIFEKAGLEYKNYEIRLDGNKINIDDSVYNGKLLVAMKMIKGNKEVYVSELPMEEIEIILEAKLPQVIDVQDVVTIDDEYVMVQDYILNSDTFDSIYILTEEVKEIEGFTEELETVEEEHICKCNKGREYIEAKLVELEKDAQFYWSQYREKSIQVELLKDVLNNM